MCCCDAAVDNQNIQNMHDVLETNMQLDDLYLIKICSHDENP